MNQLVLPVPDIAETDLVAISGKFSAAAELIWQYFDAAYYVRRYADIDLTEVDPLRHYCVSGWRERRDPSATFSTRDYLDARPDVAALDINPLLHWALFGRHEVRPPGEAAPIGDLQADMSVIAARFDAAYYRRTYTDIDRRGLKPLEHFCRAGWRDRRNPCEWFSTALYLAHHADVAATGANPFVHYVQTGERERRRIWPARSEGPRELVLDRRATLVAAPDLRDLVRYVPVPQGQVHGRFDAARLQIHWVIPPVQIGSTAQMTVFRLVHLLELQGHDCFLWLDAPATHLSAAETYDRIVDHFQSIRAPVALIQDGFFAAGGDVVFATAWQSVAKIRAAAGFRERAYLVQDAALGCLAAEATFGHDLACICTSELLATKLRDDYGAWTRHFSPAVDQTVYRPAAGPRIANTVPRIALHASGEPGATDLVLLGLERLAEEGACFHVDLFGADMDTTRAPFSATLHGVLAAESAGRLYRSCDLGIAGSGVAQDMMACGLPVVTLDRADMRAVFPADILTFARPDPLVVARQIKALLADPDGRARQAEAASVWVAGLSSQNAVGMVEAALVERLMDRGHPRKPPSSRQRKAPPHASVCIPTCNGGAVLLRLLDQVRAQRAPWPFEIVVVDSGSTDGTAEQMAAMADLQFHQVPRDKSGPGRTRNLCAGLARGRMIAFLTQDALDVSESWLFHLVSVLEHFPQAAGAFGRQASAQDQGFSSRNCCLRRAAWEQTPFPDVASGEDRLWAERIAAAGLRNVFVPAAIVRHLPEDGVLAH